MPLAKNQVTNDRRLLGFVINGNPDIINNTLQFDDTTKSFIWVPSGGGKSSMGDLEFIQKRVLDGDYFQESDEINNINDTIEFVVPDGKTAFLIEAKIVLDSATGIVSTIGGIFINSVRRDVADVSTITNIGISEGTFKVLGLSLVGNGIRKIEVKNIGTAGSSMGTVATMSGYLINTV